MAKPIGDLTARGPLAHNPHIIAAESRGEARGRAAVLAEVAKLPSPWDEDIAAADPETNYAKVRGWCNWCHVHVEIETTHGRIMVFELVTSHPDNGCLWARAHAAGVAAPEGNG
jgi:hypothetical protein